MATPCWLRTASRGCRHFDRRSRVFWRCLQLPGERAEARYLLNVRRHCQSLQRVAHQREPADGCPDMTGTWTYRSEWTGLIVGDYSVARNENGELVVTENPSRNGHKLTGVLCKSCGDWYVAELQHGYACRLRLDGSDRMLSQYREKGGDWEPVMSSERLRPQSPGRRAAVLVVSLLASGACSGKIFGWSMGLGMVMLIFVHELGHALAMYALGVPVGPMVFVPLVGAAVKMQTMPGSAMHEAIIAMAGPALGTVPTLACLAAVLAGCDPYLFLTLTKFGLLVNLGNLLPLGALDGGRIAPTLSPWAVHVGFVASAALTAVHPDRLVPAAFCAAFAYRFWQPLATIRKADRPEHYFESLTSAERNRITGCYFGLAGILAAAVAVNESLFQQIYGHKAQQE